MKKYRFALMSFVFVALAAYALSPATQWGDVSPTNTLRGAMETTITNVAFGRYVPLDGSLRMLGPLATPYVTMGDGNAQATYDYYGITYRFWGNPYRFNFPSMADPGVGSSTNTSFATRYWTDGFVSNRVAKALAGYAYNLYPVDVGGGTRTVKMPSAQNTNNYVAVGWDVAISNDNTTCVGNMTKALGANSTAIGCNTEARADNALVVGANSTAFGTQALAVGNNAEAQRYSTAIGQGAKANTDSTALGFQALANSVTCGTALGSHAEVTAWNGVAVGQTAQVTAEGAVQIGQGTNNSNNTFKVFNRMLLDADGHVPLLAGKSYDLSLSSDVTRALEDIITALGGKVQ